MCKNFENSVFNRLVSSTLGVILRRYSLPEVPRRRIHNVIAKAMSICVAFSNKVMDTRLPQPVGCGDKYDIDSNAQYGRLMIEMLGVLAIIGVLSVGGLAGYSKAMLMWHSNLQRHALATLIANAISLKPNLIAGLKEDNVEITSIFNAVGAVPEGFTFKNNRLYDLDNNMIFFDYGARKIGQENGSYYMQYEYLMGIRVTAGTDRLSLSAQDYCRNIFLVAKEIPQEINNVAFSSKDSDNWSGSKWQNLWVRADFKTATMAQVNETCRLAAKEGGTGTFYIFLKAD